MTGDMPEPKRPLDGVRVLDLSRVLAGPHCGRLLVDLGADVIKVEPPEGDLTRFATMRVNSLSAYFVQQNVGKRNISVDFTKPGGVDLVGELAAHVDVLLENFRPGVLDRLGLGYQEISARNPRIIYTSISGYGQQGPWRDRPAYAPTVHAEMGWLEVIARGRDEPPFHDPASHADVYSGVYSAGGVLAALYQRERTGVGTHIDIAMAEVLLCATEHIAAEHVKTRKRPAHFDDPSPIFRMRDGRYVTVSADPTPRGSFARWCKTMEMPELGNDPRFVDDDTRREHRDALLGIIQDWILRFDDVESLDKEMRKGNLVLGFVRTFTEAASTDWADARGAIVDISDRADGHFKVPNSPWRFSNAESGAHGVPAYRGEHNRDVLKELLGYDDAKVDSLEGAEIISSRPPRSAG
ncbi:MAG TPA: CaiB/BaiF CoA-transferase family protein [Actinomycetota bacterium]|jgi:crotonobetainyl-CoA:carnitine CoA-transferase CaiB-like acyl-CoA transferase|nr:CaiB/BaiF CoA-transferase family protein [Actinomycetota bacterium]